MAAAPIEAASLVYSTDALKYRAAKAGLSTEEIDAIININVKSLAQLAFATTPPGTSPSDDAVKDFFSNQVAVNLATITGLKLLIFEAHTLVVANIKSEISKKDDSSSQPSCHQPRETVESKNEGYKASVSVEMKSAHTLVMIWFSQ